MTLVLEVEWSERVEKDKQGRGGGGMLAGAWCGVACYAELEDMSRLVGTECCRMNTRSCSHVSKALN